MDPGADAVADRLFLELTRRFASPKLADDDVSAALRLAQIEPGKPVADLGCGYGRHLRGLIAAGHPQPLGIDRSALLLAEARREAPRAQLLRADLRALPLHAASLAAAFCFYSSMFLGTHEDALAALREAARALRPLGSLVLTTDNPLRLAANPRATYSAAVDGLGQVREESWYDPVANVDRVTKTVTPRGAASLSATVCIRYYAPPELAELARAAGLSLRRLEPDAPLTEDTPQLIALLEKAS
jgi:SAM-dependent methyltransferase